MDDVKGPDTPECFEQMVSEYQSQLRRLCCVLLKDPETVKCIRINGTSYLPEANEEN